MTYSELIQEINHVSERYSQIQLNEKVGLLQNYPINNSIDYFAIHQQGGILCFFNHKWSSTMINDFISRYGIHWMIHDNQILFTQHDRKQSRNLVQDQMLHIGFTSGTTGLPKAYYRNEQSWAVSYEENEKLLKHETEVFIEPGPLSHSLSLYACIYALFTGRTFIGQKVFNVNRLINLINEIGLTTSLFVVPTMLHQFIVQKGYAHSIKCIFSSGAKLLQDQFQKVTVLYPNADLIEFFGASEASFISYNFNQTAPNQWVNYFQM